MISVNLVTLYMFADISTMYNNYSEDNSYQYYGAISKPTQDRPSVQYIFLTRGRYMGYSKKSLNGVILHYDDDNKLTGYSKPSFNGSYDNYDADGKRISYSVKELTGYETRDLDNNRIGYSKRSFNDSYDHYNASGKRTSYSVKTGYGYKTRNTDSKEKNKVVYVYTDDKIKYEKGVTYVNMHKTHAEETKQILIALVISIAILIIIYLL